MKILLRILLREEIYRSNIRLYTSFHKLTLILPVNLTALRCKTYLEVNIAPGLYCFLVTKNLLNQRKFPFVQVLYWGKGGRIQLHIVSSLIGK